MRASKPFQSARREFIIFTGNDDNTPGGKLYLRNKISAREGPGK